VQEFGAIAAEALILDAQFRVFEAQPLNLSQGLGLATGGALGCILKPLRFFGLKHALDNGQQLVMPSTCAPSLIRRRWTFAFDVAKRSRMKEEVLTPLP